jgi:hypothetical protein
VIEMYRLWTIRSYVSPVGNDLVRKWYDAQTFAVQAAFDTVVLFLLQSSFEEWRRPEFSMLKGKYTKLGELRFDVGNVEYRPLGFFGPCRSEFTILIGATKKGRVYHPRSALDTALSRRAAVLIDPEHTNVWEI